MHLLVLFLIMNRQCMFVSHLKYKVNFPCVSERFDMASPIYMVHTTFRLDKYRQKYRN